MKEQTKLNDKTRPSNTPRGGTPVRVQQTQPLTHLVQLARERPEKLTAVHLTQLQSVLGNRAVNRLVNQHAASAAQTSQHAPSLVIQPKLQVNAVGDKYEQEADAVAKEVVQKLNTPQTDAVPPHAQRQIEGEETIAQRIQRQAAPEEEEMQLQRQETEDEELQLHRQELEEEEPQEMAMLQREAAPEEEELQLQRQELPEEEEIQLQRQALEAEDPAQLAMTQRQPQDFTHGGPVDSHIEAQINQSRGGGQPMEDSIRLPMEQAFGADFSDVRIHTDTQAHTLNQAIQARAFTTGQDIFFKEVEYSHGNSDDQELLIHELTHVVQQNQGVSRQPVIPEEQIIELPPVNITGDSHFYPKAIRSNKFYAENPPASGWPYKETLRQLWNQKAFEDFADKVRTYQEELGGNLLQPDGILGPKTARMLMQIFPNDGTNSQVNQSDESIDKLEIIDKEAGWIIFNRPAFRKEVIEFLWGGNFTPSITELHSPTTESNEGGKFKFDIGETHWKLAQSGFFEGANVLYEKMEPQAKKQLEYLENHPKLEDYYFQLHPWIPWVEWVYFLHAEENIYVIPDATPLETDIILVKRDGVPIEGYVEAPTNEDDLFEQLRITKPSLVKRLLGFETPNQAQVRWLSKANLKFNEYMLQQIRNGVTPSEAFNNYPDAVLTSFLYAFTKVISLSAPTGVTKPPRF